MVLSEGVQHTKRFFSVDGGGRIEILQVGHHRPASETPFEWPFKWRFAWRADGGPTCWLDSFVSF